MGARKAAGRRADRQTAGGESVVSLRFNPIHVPRLLLYSCIFFLRDAEAEKCISLSILLASLKEVTTNFPFHRRRLK